MNSGSDKKPQLMRYQITIRIEQIYIPKNVEPVRYKKFTGTLAFYRCRKGHEWQTQWKLPIESFYTAYERRMRRKFIAIPITAVPEPRRAVETGSRHSTPANGIKRR